MSVSFGNFFEDSVSTRKSIVRLLAQGERLNTVLAEICESVEKRLPGTKAAIQLVAPSGNRLIHGGAPSLPDSYNQAINGLQISPSSGTCGTAAALGERVITPDITIDAKWRNFVALARTHGLRACWSEPIHSGNGGVIGTFAIYRMTAGSPEEAEIEIVSEFKDLASLAIQHRNSIDAHTEAHARLSNLTANIPGIVLQWSVTADNKKALTFMSDGVSKIAGQTREALIEAPRRLLRNIQIEDRRGLLLALDECARTGEPVTKNFRVRSETENVLWLRLLVRPRKREDNVTVCDALGLDITDHMEFERRLEESQREMNTKFIELQRTKARLEVQTDALMKTTDEVTKARDMAEDASRAKSEFLSNMSHELRTPLNAIMGFSDIIREQTFGPVGSIKYRDYARDINDAGRHLLELSNDVLDFSKIESGNEELYEEWIDVHETIRSITRMLHDQAKRSEVDLTVDTPKELPPLFADEKKLRQILINLLSNALKFTDWGGSVSLTTWYSDSRGYVFQVEDTGIGISLEDIPKALGLFGQVGASKNLVILAMICFTSLIGLMEDGMSDQPGFFDLDERYAALSAAGDPLLRLGELVDFELFRRPLIRVLRRSDRRQGGRPPYDPVLMFKILVLQALYNLSDDQTEFQIRDRLSFMRFLGLGLHARVPDAKTIWLFRELLVQAKAIEALFDRFDEHLRGHGYLALSGQIVDATIVAAPRQRNSVPEKVALKAGKVPEEWKDKPAKLAQKDRDARWTMKRGRVKRLEDGRPKGPEIMVPAFGYKNHISTDRRHGLIRKWRVTDAAANDGRQLAGLIDPENTASPVWADTAYRSKRNEKMLARQGKRSQIHFRKPRGKPMPATLAKANAARSAVRSAVEHVFAHQKGLMALSVRTIGIARAEAKIGMTNLAYNMRRFLWLQGRSAPT